MPSIRNLVEDCGKGQGWGVSQAVFGSTDTQEWQRLRLDNPGPLLFVFGGHNSPARGETRMLLAGGVELIDLALEFASGSLVQLVDCAEDHDDNAKIERG